MEITKNALRKEWLKHRLNLSEPEKNNRSFQIQDLIFSSIKITQFNSVNIFLPVHEKCEVRTWSVIQYFQEKYPQISLSAPKIDSIQDRTMNAVEIEKQTSYVQNKWGINEPEFGRIIPPEEIDLIFLPLITFDQHGHRLGYGGGFYDRYLKNSPKSLKIGLSFFEPIEKIPEITSFDVKMDLCICPDSVYKFN